MKIPKEILLGFFLTFEVVRWTNQYTLFLILTVTALLRFWRFWEIPFTHDEFSVLLRLNYENLSDLIQQGVKELDTHPAGNQVFMYLWTGVFGTNEFVFKLPYILMGIGSIYLIYLIAKKLSNESTGLIAAAIACGMQYTVMHGQIARPYISGLFLCLMLFLYLIKMAQDGDGKFWKNLFLFSFFGSLCAYNHHFSLLQAALIGISGFYFLAKKYWWKYCLSGVFIFVLYSPHLSIFFYQLKKGGVAEWLAPPETDFLWQYFRYIFNYSWFFLFTGIALFFWGLKNVFSLKWMESLLFFGLFFIPFFIGYFYSIHVNAVLQFSVLIFGFPFLLLGMLRGIEPLSRWLNLILVCFILSLGSFTLVFNRQHYSVFYESVFYEPLKVAQALPENVPVLIDSNGEISTYMYHKMGVENRINRLDKFKTPSSFLTFLDSTANKSNQFFFSEMDFTSGNYLAYIRDIYPKTTEKKNLFLGSYYLLSKNGKQEAAPFKKIPMKFNSEGLFYLDSLTEWGPGLAFEYKSLKLNKNDLIDIALKIENTLSYQDALIVCQISSDTGVIHWSASRLGDWISQKRMQQQALTFHHTVKLSSLNLDRIKNPQVKIFLWNKGRKEILIRDFSIYLQVGNPILYGLIEEI